jgi:NAD(P)-dependent dehydrogenase (short-subunit alcohol dehydrogenase family)
VTNVLDLFRLDGKVAVVTGASSGLGADIVLAARRTGRLQEVAAQIEDLGRRALPVEADIADPDSCQAMVHDAIGGFGRIDILVNNAGVGTAVPTLRETPEQFRHVIDVNLNGCTGRRSLRPGHGARLQHRQRQQRPGPDQVLRPQAAYAASKAGVLGLIRDLAQQWSGRRGIRVNAIAPGYFASEMTVPSQHTAPGAGWTTSRPSCPAGPGSATACTGSRATGEPGRHRTGRRRAYPQRRHLPEAEQPAVLAQALAAATAITNDYIHAEALAGLAPHLPADLVPQALGSAPRRNPEPLVALLERAWALQARGTHLTYIGLLRDCLTGIDRGVCLDILVAAAPAIAATGGQRLSGNPHMR